ncbi:MAG: hypothetical protein ACFFAU_00330 [Candidatus Hodarchaeota archaeon]
MTMIQLFTLNSILNRWSNERALPLEIPIIDDTIGGLLPSLVHSINGETGAGKTIFCLRVINSLFRQNNESKVLYSEFNGNLRLSTIKKIISKEDLLNQIDFFKPKSLIEQIIFFRNLTKEPDSLYNLIIIDTLFGSPLDASRYLGKEPRIWKKRIFNHLLDLKNIAENWEVPILLTNYPVISPNEQDFNLSYSQYGEDLLTPIIPINMIIHKRRMKHILEFRLFQNLVASSEFTLILDK